jgi:hypothetical protein
MMKSEILAIGLVLMMTTGSYAGEPGDEGSGNTTIVRNGNSVSIITQSGDPSQAEVKIEKEPGHTFIYRRSGGNTTTITQSTSPAELPPDALPPWLRLPQR